MFCRIQIIWGHHDIQKFVASCQDITEYITINASRKIVQIREACRGIMGDRADIIDVENRLQS